MKEIIGAAEDHYAGAGAEEPKERITALQSSDPSFARRAVYRP
jgi:hypothetical protein